MKKIKINLKDLKDKKHLHFMYENIKIFQFSKT